MPEKQPVFIFDFGNVIAFFDFDRARQRIADLTGIPVDELKRRAQASNLAALVREFEHGRIPPDSFATEACNRLDVALVPDQFHACWAEIFWLNHSVAQLVAQLDDAGFTLVLGSNTNQTHAQHFVKQFAPTLDRFDHLVFSHEVGHMKPAPEFYRACVRAANAPAHQCVFIDDLAENVAGARHCGLNAIHFKEANQLVAEFVKLGITHPLALDSDPNPANNP